MKVIKTTFSYGKNNRAEFRKTYLLGVWERKQKKRSRSFSQENFYTKRLALRYFSHMQFLQKIARQFSRLKKNIYQKLDSRI